MTLRTGLTRADAQELLALRDKLGIDPPVRGTHVGGGRHVDMPDTWDGTGKRPPGWRGASGVFEEEEQEERMVDGVKVVSYRKLGTYAVGIAPDTETRLTRDAARLTEAEKSRLETLANITVTREVAEPEVRTR